MAAAGLYFRLLISFFFQMRDLVNRKSYRLRKSLDDFLFWVMPTVWVPLYNSVSFTHMPYKKCIENRKWQDKVRFIAIMSRWRTLKKCFCFFPRFCRESSAPRQRSSPFRVLYSPHTSSLSFEYRIPIDLSYFYFHLPI